MKYDRYMVVIEADYNDCDMVEQSTFIEENDIVRFKSIVEIIRERGPWVHNWATGDCTDKTIPEQYDGRITEDDVDFMERYVPFGNTDSGYGIHTITNVTIYIVTGEEKLI